jgi:SAM-dependent methyltransferase
MENGQNQTAETFDWVVCPRCLGKMQKERDQLSCQVCDRLYPIYAGIPDFRSVADSEAITQGSWKEEDHLLGRMLEKYPVTDLPGLLEEMLAGLENRTEADREHLRRYFVEGLPGRARHRALTLELICKKYGQAPLFSRILEIGCGAGATLFELSIKGEGIGIDPNLLHLLIAKKHAESIGRSVKLACAYAEHLPFRNDSFTFVHFMHTLEHFSNQERGLSEVRRVLSPGGLTCFDIPNRFSLWREPHTQAWGIGFLPRRWTALSAILNLSFWNLKRLVRKSFGHEYAIYTMLIRFNVPGVEGGRGKRTVASILQAAERVPLLHHLVRFFQPGFEVVAQKKP